MTVQALEREVKFPADAGNANESREDVVRVYRVRDHHYQGLVQDVSGIGDPYSHNLSDNGLTVYGEFRTPIAPGLQSTGLQIFPIAAIVNGPVVGKPSEHDIYVVEFNPNMGCRSEGTPQFDFKDLMKSVEAELVEEY
tara:strand:- start:552 stop:965 length:414 start_codon:yes stop_codon:yes gene_type:complete